QAEDGIRDRNVTGVQTCALPILPVIVRDLDDDAATIIMVDSNLQRESLLPSERAFAYRMNLEAMNHQGKRADLTCGQVGHKSVRSEERRVGKECRSRSTWQDDKQ